MFAHKTSQQIANANPGVKNRFAVALVCFIVSIGFVGLAITQSHSHLLELRFNPFAVLSAITVVVNSCLLLYFLRKPARTDERIWLTLYMVGLIVYAIGEFMWRLSGNPIGAVFWTNVSDAGSIIPAAVYLFVLTYTNRTERKYVGLTALLLMTALLYVHFVGTTTIIFSNNPHDYTPHAWGLDAEGIAIGPGVIIGLLWYFAVPFLAWLRLMSFRRHTRNAILRRQSLIFIWATAIPILGGVFTDVLLPSFGVPIPAFGVTLFTPGAILIVYGLLRYQLLTVSPTLFSNTILGIMQESVVVTDDKFNVVYLNPKAEAMLGIKAEASDNVSLLSVMQKSSAETFQQAFANFALQATGEIDIDQVDLKPIHAGPVPVRVTGSRLPLSDLNMWVVALSDITKELQTRSVIEHEVQVRTKELQEARAYLLSSINSLEQGFVLLNAKLSVEVMNQRARQLFGTKADELLRENVGSLSARLKWNADFGKMIERVVTTKHFRQYEAESADGSFYQVYISPVLLQEHVLGVAAIIQDITEQRILDRSKDEFFSIASHELRTPLTAIRGNMAMVKDYFPEALKDEGLASMVADTHDASIRLIAIVNDFLDSSKLEQGKMEFSLQPTVIGPIVDAAAKDLKNIFEKQEDKLTIEKLDKLPKVMADEARVRQIVYNLLSNSAKYTQNSTVTVSAQVKDDKLLLRVADTGKGISPENQKLLFHKFQQAGDPLTRDDTKGTGLGLYISRLLAKNMHGDVELEHSEEGKGSTFVLSLPLAKK